MEIWKQFHDFYEVSNTGKVKSLPRTVTRKDGITRKVTGKILKPFVNPHGYLTFRLQGISYQVHRIVAETFIPNPENKPQVNHKDLNKSNNDISNLEWVTHKENTHHAIQNGAMNNCRKQHAIMIEKRKKKISQYDLEDNYLQTFDSITSASKSVNTTPSNITKACKGKLKTCKGFIWKYL